MRESIDSETGTSGRVQSSHDQTELGHVAQGKEKGKGGIRCSSQEANGSPAPGLQRSW